MRATHISIIHRPSDPRIFHKECKALVRAGYEVHLVIGGPPDVVDGVRCHSVARTVARPLARHEWARLARAAVHAVRLWPSIYHLHDPHLIPLGVMLKLGGAPVVYDVHEDYPAHARSKLVGRPLRGWSKALLWRALEWIARHTFDGFVCASPTLSSSFVTTRTVVVGNFPITDQFANGAKPPPYRERANILVATGLLTKIRSTIEIMQAIELLPAELDCRLHLIGAFRPPELQRAAGLMDAWARTRFLGYQPHDAVVRELQGAKVGSALLHPLPNHQDAWRSNKLFEYMASGIPVIAPNFSSWREIVAGNRCGVLVDPCDPVEIAAAIERLLRDPKEAEAMGLRGRRAVEREFNWASQEQRLLSFYRELLDRRAAPAAAAAAR